jgi:hypothetical protein
MSARSRVLWAGLALCALLGACDRKQAARQREQEARTAAVTQVKGLAAIPAGARVVMGFDVKGLAGSGLVRHGLRRLLERDPVLASRLDGLQQACKLDVARDLDDVVLARMSDARTSEVVLVASGRFDQQALLACVGTQVTPAGGAVAPTTRDGQITYLVTNPGGSDVSLGFGAPGTVVVSDSDDVLRRALDARTARVTGEPEVMALLARTDTRAALWGAGFLSPEVAQGLMAAGEGKIKAPARAIWGFVRPGKDGLSAELGVLMASEADARAAVEVASRQLQSYAVLAQGYGLGPMVSKIRTEAQGDVFTVRLTLDADELAKLETLVDGSPSQSTEPKEVKGASQ